MSFTLAAVVLLGTVLTVATLLGHVYAVGRGLNDHFVAAVVLGCMGFYLLLAWGAPRAMLPPLCYGMIGLWGLFYAIDRGAASSPIWMRWLLAYPSQVAYAFALWGGLIWLIRFPLALWQGWALIWPGPVLWIALGLAVLGTAHCYLWGDRIRVYRVAGAPVRIVQLSDLHASSLMHAPELHRLAARVNALQPDLVVVTGDLVMPFSEREHAYLLEGLRRIQAPVYACAGNHDLPVLDALRRELGAVGIPLLVDEAVVLEHDGRRTIELVGVQFHWTNARDHFLKALETLPQPRPGTFRVLLAHDPRVGRWTPEGRFDLVLSGHTHGGQVGGEMIGLPFTLLSLMGVRDRGFWTAGGAPHYVHRGNWFTGLPPRMGVAGEIAVFEGIADEEAGG